MSARIYRVILPVKDINRAAAFYSGILGGQGMRVSEGRHYFDCGGVILACFDPKADGDGYEPAPNPEWIYFAVPDVEKTYEACEAQGAIFAPDDVHGDPAGKVALRPWGERSFYVFDPFGNKLCFVDERTMYTGG